MVELWAWWVGNFQIVLLLNYRFLCFCMLNLQRAEEETARLYQEFVESFEVDNTPGSKAFVRGGLINPNEKQKSDSEGPLK